MAKNVITLRQLNSDLTSMKMCSIGFGSPTSKTPSCSKKPPNRLALVHSKAVRSHSDLLKLLTSKEKVGDLALVIHNDDEQDYASTKKDHSEKRKTFIRTKSGKIFRGIRFRSKALAKAKRNNGLYDSKLFKEETIQEHDSNLLFNSNDNYTPYNVEKPFQLAGTIYKELSRQKALFFKRLRATQSFQNLEGVLKSTQQPLMSSKSQGKKTCLLDRKHKDALPMNLPVFVSYNKQYDSMSEKRRHEKTMEYFLKLKSFIDGNPDESLACIREFLLKNGVNSEEVDSYEKLTNFNRFLHGKIAIDPKKSFHNIIEEALNTKAFYDYQYDTIEEVTSSKANAPSQTKYPTIISGNTPHNRAIFKERKEKDRMKLIDQDKFSLKVNQKDNRRDIKKLISDLEDELSLIQSEKSKKISSLKESACSSGKMKEVYYEDSNAYVPNLCLSNMEVNSHLIRKAQEKREKMLKRANLQSRIKEINNRMYYNNIFNSNNNDVDYIEMRRKNKLTEFIILERAKKALSIENCKVALALKDTTPFAPLIDDK